MAADCRHWVNAMHLPATNAIDRLRQAWKETGAPTSGHLLHQQHSSLFTLVPARCSLERRLMTLQVGNHTTGNTHDVSRCSTEVVIPSSRRSPHLVILQQVWINKHTQLSCMTKGRHAAVGLGNSLKPVLLGTLFVNVSPNNLKNFNWNLCTRVAVRNWGTKNRRDGNVSRPYGKVDINLIVDCFTRTHFC